MSVKVSDLAAEMAEAHDLQPDAALEVVETITASVLQTEGAAAVDGGQLPADGTVNGDLVLTDDAAQAVRDGLTVAQD